jgi:OmcA/MtrC family decaheme c-type cytochrome
VLTNYKGLSISVLLAWPTTDFEHYISQSAVSINATGTTITLPSGGAILEEMGGGVYRYTFKPDATHPIPSASPDPGTFAAALAGRVNFVHDGATATQGTDNNGYTEFTLDGSKALVSRREVVDDETKCDKCHGELRAHGEQRFGIRLCLMCHNPVTSDVSRRLNPSQYPPLSVHFKSLIHHIHRGENLENPYTIYGFASPPTVGTPHDFTEVRFPGLLQKCDICHVDQDTANVPLPDDALPTTFSYTTSPATSPTTSTTLPTRQACVACHDGADANLHTVLQSDLGAGTESCAVCHEEAADFAVSKVHALAP